MIVVRANGNEYELGTDLGTLEKIQERLGKAATEIFTSIGELPTGKQITLLSIAAGDKGLALRADILADSENWGMFRLNEALEELVARMLFSGGPEEQERQISKAFKDDEELKNEMRAILNLPQKGP